MIRPDLCRRQFGDRQFLRTVVKENDLEAVAGILRADEVRESQCDFLRRRESVLAVEDHRVRAVEHDDGRTRRAVILLMNVEIAVLEVERHAQPFASDGREQRRVDVEIDRVAKLVLFRAKAASTPVSR